MNKIELGTILKIQKGKKPKEQSQTQKEGFVPYVDIKAFEKGIVENYATTEKSLLCNDGDLLIVCDGSRSGLTGIAINGAVGSTLAKISADGLTTEYLRYFIQSKYTLLNTQKKGTGTPHLNAEILKKSMIYVPPLEEQHRIVSRIEEMFSELDNAVATLKETKQKLAVYRQAVLKEAFEGIDSYKKLIDICDKIFDGPFGSNLKTQDYTDSGVRVVRLENLKNLFFDNSKQSFVTEEKYQTIKGHTVYPTDILFSTFIAEETKVCQMPSSISFAINKADCIGIRVKEEYFSRYVMYYLASKKVYQSLLLQVHGATRPRVNTKQIKSIYVPVCEKKQQIHIVKIIEEKLSECDNIEKTIDTALQQAEALRQSILKKAFEGGL